MSIYAGPEIDNNGLVFAYDMSNNKKSWIGVPTTNLITNPLPDGTPSNFTNGGGTGTLTYDTTTQAIKWVKNTYETWGTYLYFNPVFDGNLSTTESYTISFEWKTENTSVSNSVYVYDLIRGDGVSGAVAGIYLLSNSILQENGWYFFKYTFIPANTGVTAYNRVRLGNQSTNVSTFYIRKIQFEKSPFASTFVNGTRSNTQSLLDLTKANTITVNSLTYAADNTFSFNGTSDYATLGTSIDCYNKSYSLEAWIKRNAIGVNHGIIGDLQYNWFAFRITSTNQLLMRHAGVSTNSITGISNILSNIWYHVVGTFDTGSGMKLYVNGKLDNSNLDTAVFGLTGIDRGPKYLGRSDVSAFGTDPLYFNGSISNFKGYSGRALTAAEIQQNFIATRSRYGI